MVPHSMATVSLATAVLPQLSSMAAGEDLAGVSRTVASTLRTALVVIMPFALLLPVIALDISHVVWGHGAAGTTYATLRALAVAVRDHPGVLHQPLPDAARLLRLRAHPHRVLGAVRRAATNVVLAVGLTRLTRR